MERRYRRACKYCKEKGHKPAHCDRPPVKAPSIALTEKQFRMVKDMQSEGRWVSAEVAELGIDCAK
jgi:hypothetical protein